MFGRFVAFSALLIPAAHADAPFGGGAASGMLQFVPFIAIFVLMYFLILRPNQKKEKERRAMVAALKRGDRVLTGAGMIGTVHKIVNDEEVLLEIAENVRVRLLRSAVVQILAKGELVALASVNTSQEESSQEGASQSKKETSSEKKASSKPAVSRRKKTSSL